MNEWILSGVILLGISIIINIILILYIRHSIVRVFVISETASEIFTQLDAFREHLSTMYELPTYYGDETLNNLLQHVKSLIDYLSQYEGIYSFTQPDLIEQLEEATRELQEENDQETPQEKE